jgi:hypothetical protein
MADVYYRIAIRIYPEKTGSAESGPGMLRVEAGQNSKKL